MAILIKPLTASQCEKKKYSPIQRENILRDGGGLYLHIGRSGRKVWRLDYRRPFTQKETSITFGEFPNISLLEAREIRTQFKDLLKQHIDPKTWLREQQLSELRERENTFFKIAERWREDYKRHIVTEPTMIQDWLRLELHAFPKLATMPISEINSQILIEAFRPLAKQGKTATLEKILRLIVSIMDFAENTGFILSHNCQKARKGFHFTPAKNLAALSPQELPRLLKDILQARNNESIEEQTYRLFCWHLLTGVRPSESISAEWSEIDWDNAVWHIPSEKMKGRKDQKRAHSVPLSSQALQLLKLMQRETGAKRFIFQSKTRLKPMPMSQETLNVMLKRNGYKGVMTSHGTRSIISTYLNEQGCDPDAVEAVLAHRVRGNVRRVYNRSDYLEQRKPMMQHWADYCTQSGLQII